MKTKLLKTAPWILLVAAISMIVSGTIGSSNAALTYYSENYTAQLSMLDIGVTLVETSGQGTKDISHRDYTGADDVWNEVEGALLTDMLKESNDELQIGRKYKEELSVRNSGTIDEYVRVRVYKYWVDKNNSKDTTLDPANIEIHLTNNQWIHDTDASTIECDVLYWPKILPVGQSTVALTDTLRLNPDIATTVDQKVDSKGNITTTYLYDNRYFVLRAEVDGVQTHNAVDAIKSAWGIDVNIDGNGNLSLAK